MKATSRSPALPGSRDWTSFRGIVSAVALIMRRRLAWAAARSFFSVVTRWLVPMVRRG
jgi:hypothetical protein